MSGVGSWSGWMAAALALVPWWRIRRERAARGEAVLRACHELRGPLTAVRLGVELGRTRGGLSEVHWRAIEGELDRVAVALADLQSAPAGETAVPELRALDLRALLADSVQAWRPCADAAGVQLDLRWAGGHPRVRGDRVRLAQAAGNLIANAIEHGGGRVQVRGGRWDGGARIEVSDDGPGLPANVTRLTQGSHRRGARGRGLAIVAGVAEAHGGRLAAMPSGEPEGAAGKAGKAGKAGGTCLVLELPDGAARRS